MKTQKIIALLLALILVVGTLAACGKTETKTENKTEETKTEEKKDEAKTEEKKDFADYTLADWEAYADQLHAEGKDKDYHILYLSSWAASEYFVNSQDIWSSMLEKEFGWKMEMIGPTNYTPESQLSTLESALVSQEYDLILLYPIDQATFDAVKDDQWETYHTPVVIFGMDPAMGGAQYYTAASAENEGFGYGIAGCILDYVRDNWDYFKKYEGTDGIPMYVGNAEANPNQAVRTSLARDLLLSYDKEGIKFKLLDYSENIMESEAIQYAETLILNHPEVEIILLYNDVFSTNFNTAFEEAGKDKFSPYLGMFGNDCNASNIAAIKENNSFIKGTVGGSKTWAGAIYEYMFPIAIAAAKEGYLVDGLTEACVEMNDSPQYNEIHSPAFPNGYYKAEWDGDASTRTAME